MRYKKIIIASIFMLILIGGMTLFFNPYSCSRRITNAIINPKITKEDFRKIVIRNHIGINSSEFASKIWMIFDGTNFRPLQVACREGDIEKVEILLEYGADPNLLDETVKSTPLLFALLSGKPDRFDIAMLLLKSGANPNYINSRNENALFCSLIIVDSDNNIQIEKSLALFKQLLKISKKDLKNVGSNTLLGEAAAFNNQPCLEYILKNNINGINDASKSGRTPLMSCVMVSDNVELCYYLIQHGADKALKNNEGKTAYDIAKEYGHEKCAKLCAME